ncbi:MAG: citramalate synthase [Alphaproteobacteria bacterium]|nr:citramalate synthase [Alphaproteobacteria bacterium]
MSDRIFLFDTTLRDGGQTQGVDFSAADKRAIAEALDAFGIDYVEGGWPGANPTDDAFFAAPPALETAKLVAFGMTRRPGRSVDNDPGLSAVLNQGAGAACLVAKTWDFHVTDAINTTPEENLSMIGESIERATAKLGEAMLDAEHFFDGYKANPDYALSCLETAYEAGARWMVLCDTNGGCLPGEIHEIVAAVAKRLPGDRLGIHCHDDTGNAVANSLAAVDAGVRQIQGTLNGLGERCGNANIITCMANLGLKTDYDIGIPTEKLSGLRGLSRLLDERLNRPSARQAPYVGDSAFAHKGGLHVSAIEKNPALYEHVTPESVGNHRTIVVSDQAGRSNILSRFKEIGIEIDPKDPDVFKLVDLVKRREHDGYAYDGAEASFELLARRMLQHVPSYFSLDSFRVMDERRFDGAKDAVSICEATVMVRVGETVRHEVAVGNGPVNAADIALRKALTPFYRELADLTLTDYKVRILNSSDGTRAVTRVMIETSDADGNRWNTVGVSANILDASVDALMDSLVYKLFRDGAALPGGQD